MPYKHEVLPKLQTEAGLEILRVRGIMVTSTPGTVKKPGYVEPKCSRTI